MSAVQSGKGLMEGCGCEVRHEVDCTQCEKAERARFCGGEGRMRGSPCLRLSAVCRWQGALEKGPGLEWGSGVSGQEGGWDRTVRVSCCLCPPLHLPQKDFRVLTTALVGVPSPKSRVHLIFESTVPQQEV